MIFGSSRRGFCSMKESADAAPADSFMKWRTARIHERVRVS